MCETLVSTPKRSAALDTLEQLDQRPPDTSETLVLKRVHEPKKNLQKRARAKQFSFAIGKALYAQGGPLKRAYGRGMDCTSTIVQEADGSTRTHYCGSRWCMVCNRIRTAKAISAYLPAIEAWGDDAYFVTLTVPNCRGYEIRDTVSGMNAAFTSCKRAIKRTHGLSFEAIRKLEITYNAEKDTYHPHFHIVVNGEVEARALVSLWMDRTPSAVSAAAQDVRPVKGGAVKEMFKYFTKLTTQDKKGRTGVNAAALNVIFTEIKGLRTYQPVGFKIRDYAMQTDLFDPDGELNTENVSKAFKRHGETVNWIWEQDYSDWVDWETGECLTEYTPTPKWTELCDSIAAQAETQDTPITEVITRE